MNRRGFCFWLALLAGARLRLGTLAGGLRFFFFLAQKDSDSDLLNWGEGHAEPAKVVGVAGVVVEPIRRTAAVRGAVPAAAAYHAARACGWSCGIRYG